MRGPEVQKLRAGFDRAVTALGSVLDVEQEPVADRLALLGAQLHSSGRRHGGLAWR